ncbi:hypothetical protein [Bacteroides sp.]|uniref:hypothetical protein n=1 Tax=Bacteroides sp. TaxID=29523 RepID=UPI0026043186|nr:hypothetical protein [Bacteroides sp.]MDD3037920.1 hypothetical protein [Bacteroides sp.]
MSDRHFVDNLWRWKCGLPELEPGKPQIHTYEELRKTEWSPEFEELMRNRLIMGAMRYGMIGANNKPDYDRVSSVIQRMKQFQKTGNKELLVDVANLCLLEFVECKRPNAHFCAVDDGEHVGIK